MTFAKQWFAIAPVWYSIKMHVSCIKGPKAYNTFWEPSKYIWTTALRIFFWKYDSFTKVMWLLQNFDLQLHQFDSWKKCRYTVSKALKPKNHGEKPWKYIWTIALKIYFININSFTKVTWCIQNSDRELLQFVLPQKSRQRAW